MALRTTHLACSAAGIPDPPTAQLAAALETHLRLRSGGLSLASLSALRDRSWFGLQRQGPIRVPLAHYAVRLAETYLARGGARILLRTEGPEPGIDAADRAAHWRWLSLRLPADLLVAALYAPDGSRPFSDRVSLATAHLERLLQQPVAETHLHVGAAFGFPLMWTAWMGWLSREGPGLEKLRVDAESPFGDAAGLRGRLLSAAIARVLFAAFLWKRERRAFHEGFALFEARELMPLCERLRWHSGAVECRRLCSQALSGLSHPGDAGQFARLQRLYARLTEDIRLAPAKALDALHTADPLAAWLQPSPGETCAETLLSTRALHYLLHEGHADERFAELFWQYQRIRCLAHAHLVQEPGTSGLDWFSRHYRRLSPLRGPLEDLRFEAALQHQSAGVRLGALEARTAPMPTWTEVRDETRRLARAGVHLPPPLPGVQAPELGLIFHFIKEREHTLGGLRSLHADPGGDPAGFRFGVWYRARRREALALETALRHHPELLLLVRGLDVASTELSVPTWAVAPLLNSLRAASIDVSEALVRQRPAWRVPPLQVTCHAGEDFTRLVEGLRRIHELYTAGVLRLGDRIGHGLALGTAPRLWAASAPTVIQAAEERLEDLLWELERYGHGDVGVPAQRLERVRTEALRTARHIYGPELQELDVLIAARRLRAQASTLRRLGFPDRLQPSPPAGSPESIVWRQLTDVGVFHRGQMLLDVQVDEGEIQFLTEAQQWLVSVLARLEITVEANPSSNLLIADLLGIEEHPVLRMMDPALPLTEGSWSEPQVPREAASRLMVSINSDDPMTFATCLADEYAYLYFALLRRNIPSATALSWIDSVRAHGMRSRFTQLASADPRALAYILSPNAPARRVPQGGR
ncbi:hypothetical protein [Stigmatella erecta]|uniref:hypothetical protein n=1 Tax=Stigmatella erecta TaxID=83460 RepID=UPI000B89C494|nr:hypothetical protein [Stigmatella erecta]